MAMDNEQRRENMAKMHEAARLAREQGIHTARKTWAEKLAEKPASRQYAINAFCVQCMGGDGQVGVRGMIRDCTAPTCPLFSFRPYKPGEVEDDSE